MRSKLRWLQITTIRHLKMHVLLLAVFQENKNKVQLVLGETNHRKVNGLNRIQMGNRLQEKSTKCWAAP